MSIFDKISKARDIPELPESATLEAIKSNYRRLPTTWHPDRCREDSDKCVGMTRKIIESYQTIMDYCVNYQYSYLNFPAR